MGLLIVSTCWLPSNSMNQIGRDRYRQYFAMYRGNYCIFGSMNQILYRNQWLERNVDANNVWGCYSWRYMKWPLKGWKNYD
jgi:hypothetical protein